jgi:hypothetical protein
MQIGVSNHVYPRQGYIRILACGHSSFGSGPNRSDTILQDVTYCDYGSIGTHRQYGIDYEYASTFLFD